MLISAGPLAGQHGGGHQLVHHVVEGERLEGDVGVPVRVNGDALLVLGHHLLLGVQLLHGRGGVHHHGHRHDCQI